MRGNLEPLRIYSLDPRQVNCLLPVWVSAVLCGNWLQGSKFKAVSCGLEGITHPLRGCPFQLPFRMLKAFSQFQIDCESGDGAPKEGFAR